VSTVKPFDEMPVSALSGVHYLLSDIDDTLTDEGVFPADSYRALEDLRAAGCVVVLITGRPAGWCDMIARFFPVDAVVGENGALCFYRDGDKVRQIWNDPADVRTANLKRLHAIAGDIVDEFEGTALAKDNPWRASDVAVDFAEEVGPLPLSTAEAIRKRFEEAEATAKVSSIHVNAWFGRYDKLSMFSRWLHEVEGKTVDAVLAHSIYTGDSPNDVPMFRRFPLSVGVQGIENYHLASEDLPAYVTKADAGRGFAEVAKALLSCRNNKRA
jgi:HAD superfamily hydrolase (TIGR01484 family)